MTPRRETLEFIERCRARDLIEQRRCGWPGRLARGMDRIARALDWCFTRLDRRLAWLANWIKDNR